MWYILKVRSGLEKNIKKKIEYELAKYNVLTDVEEMFLPVVNLPIDNQTKKEYVPLKGSIFIKTNLSLGVQRAIQAVQLTGNFMKIGSQYATVTQDFIDTLKVKIEKEEVDMKDKKENFIVGERIKIVNHDVYSTFNEGVISQIKDKLYYVTVVVLGQNTVIKLEKHNLKKTK